MMRYLFLYFILVILSGFTSCSSHQQHLEFKLALDKNSAQHDVSVLKNRIFELSGENPQVIELANSVYHFKLNSFQDSALIYQAIQTIGLFEISESYSVQELYPLLDKVNNNLTSSNQLPEFLKNDTNDFVKKNPLFSLLMPSSNNSGDLVPGPVIGYLMLKDSAKLFTLLNLPEAKALLPFDAHFLLGKKLNEDVCPLYAQKINKREDHLIRREMFKDARVKSSELADGYEIIITMKDEYKIWFTNLTRNNVQKGLILSFDQLVLAAPIVQSEVSGGKFTINANFTQKEALFIATCIKSGALHHQPLVSEFGFLKNN